MPHGTAQGHMDHEIHMDLESIQSWGEKAAKEGWIAEITMTAATMAIFGWMIFALHKAMLNAQFIGTTLF